MKAPIFTPLALSLPAAVPFVGPEAQERGLGRPFTARLGANESLFGPSPHAVRAMSHAAAEVWMYGDPENYDLKQALAAHHRCKPENIVVGEGIDGLLGLLVRLMIGAGDCVVTSDGAYPTFTFHVAGFGGDIHRVPFRDLHEDPEALARKARQVRPRLVYISNPDNPMGSHHPATVIVDLLDKLPEETLLILDEAYIDLAPDGTAPQISADDPRLIRFRTFSKGYGMAGARVGYAICAPDLARSFDKVRNHFGIGRIVQAGALAALGDQEHLLQVRAQVAIARLQLADIAQRNGLVARPSATNFTCIDLGQDGDFARKTLRALAARGVFVRMPAVAPLDRHLRVSHGTPEALEIFAAALPLAMRDGV